MVEAAEKKTNAVNGAHGSHDPHGHDNDGDKKGAEPHGGRRTEEGIVISDVREKTITVEIKRLVKHARYGKYIFRSTNLHAHDEQNEAKKGDRVEIIETRPLSKQKRWRLVKIVERATLMGQLEIKEVEIAPAKAISHAAETAPASAPNAAVESSKA